jgi:hypothetical protein
LSFTPMFGNPTTLFNEMLHMKGQPWDTRNVGFLDLVEKFCILF